MKKSKLVVFLLSFLPGLSHLYVGVKERAIIFFAAFFAVLGGVCALSIMAGSDDFLILLVIALPIIWFVGLVDALMLAGRTGESRDEKQEYGGGNGLLDLNNSRLIAVVLSFVPGAGHMYLGLMNQGLQLMSLFFFTAFMMGWLNMSLFFFVLPVIWFYSLFDAYHRAKGERVEKWEENLFFVAWLRTHPAWVGWGLIILGCIVVLERIIGPYISWEIRSSVQTGIVALILILCGIRLLLGGRDKAEKEVVEECETVE